MKKHLGDFILGIAFLLVLLSAITWPRRIVKHPERVKDYPVSIGSGIIGLGLVFLGYKLKDED